jgi:hypothetical protein
VAREAGKRAVMAIPGWARGRRGRTAATRVAALAAAAFAFWRYGITVQPIVGDRALIIYNYQTVFRGEPLYLETSAGYPPLSMLLAAAAMHLAALADVPGYLAPRLASVVVMASAVWLLHGTVVRATGSALAGGTAGVALAGFGVIAQMGGANLEPKILLMALVAAGAACVQRRGWGAAGIVAGLATSTYYGGVVVGCAALVTLAGCRQERRKARAAVRLFAGGLLGLLPAFAYLAVTDSFAAFVEQTILAQHATNPVGVQTLLAGVMKARAHVLYRSFAPERVVFVVAALAFAAFLARSVLRRRTHRFCSARYASFPALAILMLVWVVLEIDGSMDVVPLLPVVAFWCAWGLRWMHARRLAPARRGVVAFAVFAAASVYLHLDSLYYHPPFTLAQQEEFVRGVAGGRRVAAFGAAEMYVLPGVRAPVDRLELTDAFTSAAWRAGGGCGRMLGALAAGGADVVVMRVRPRPPGCGADAAALRDRPRRRVSFPTESGRRRYFGGERPVPMTYEVVELAPAAGPPSR